MSAEAIAHPAIVFLRDERFHGDEDAALAFTRSLRSVDDPTFEQLVTYTDRHGPTGILESATHLTEDEFTALAAVVHKASRDPRHTDRPRRRRRS